MANKNADSPFLPRDIPFSGRWIPAVDGTLIEDGNFKILKNMRYAGGGLGKTPENITLSTHVKSVAGMTKITTNPPTYSTHTSGIHFRKTSPNESHVITQSYNSGSTASVIQEDTATIPNTGDFSATPLYTIATTWTKATAYVVGDCVFPSTSNGMFYECLIAGTSHASTEPTWTTTEYARFSDGTVTWIGRIGDLRGQFSQAPDGCIAYANGKHNLVYGGNNYRCAGFVDYDPSGSNYFYDYSNKVNNDRCDAPNTAVLHTTGGGIDANTVWMLHMENNANDSSGNGYNFTNTGMTFSTSPVKYGTYCAQGAGYNMYRAYNAAYSWNITNWTLDGDFYLNGTNCILASQITDASNYAALIYTSSREIRFFVVSGGSTTAIDLKTVADTCFYNTWYHIAVVKSGTYYYIFIDGKQRAYLNTATSFPTFGEVHVGGGNGASNNISGYVDEIRFCNVARWTSDFTPQDSAYSTASISTGHIGSALPGLTGVNWYVNNPNATAGTMSFQYWDGTTWQDVSSLSDGTVSGGVSLAQSGSASFSSTASTAKPQLINNILLYWFKVSWSAISANTSVYYVTLKTAMQPIVDLWAGTFRQIDACFKYTAAGGYVDNVINALKADAQSVLVTASTWDYAPETYVNMNSFATTSSLCVGFTQRTIAIGAVLIPAYPNTAASTITVKYWNGQSWTSVGTVSDKTLDSSQTKSLTNTGIISWNDPGELNEFKTKVSTDTEMYYYQLSWSNTLSSSIRIDQFYGLPAPATISGYSFPLMWMGCAWLCGSKTGIKNEIRNSDATTVVVWNSENSTRRYLGDNTELKAGVTLFSRYGSILSETAIIAKANELWVLDGTLPSNAIQFKVSGQYGCPAPETLKSCDLGFEIAVGVNKAVAIWQSSTGIAMFDNGSIITISQDIETYFKDMWDTTVTERVNPAMITKSVSFFDTLKLEYHWCFASGTSTSLNREFVFDIMRRKWFEIDRGSGKYLALAVDVADTNGNHYIYGAIAAGHLERLEYGNTFDSNDIAHDVWLPDKPNATSLEKITKIENIKLTGKSINTTGNITLTHYADCKTTGTSVKVFSPYVSDRRVFQKKQHCEAKGLQGVFHGWRIQSSTNDVPIGLELINLSILAKDVRADIDDRG